MMKVAAKFATRRRVLSGMAAGAAVTVGLPFLDCFLNENGTALAATGAPLPTRFGTWFWGCGFNPGRWMPNKEGAGYDMGVEMAALQPFRDKMNIVSGMKVFLDGKPAQPHTTGPWAILTGTVPRGVNGEAPSLDSLIADSIGQRTRFRSLEMACTGNPATTLSRRSASVSNPAEVSPTALYARIFGPEFVDPNGAKFTPDSSVMLRRSSLSAVKEQREDFARTLGAADRTRLDEYFTALRELEQKLSIELEPPTPLAACSVPGKATEASIGTDMATVTKNHALFAQLTAHALACGQTRVFNVMLEQGTSALRRAGDAQIHHTYTHEEPLDDRLGYQPSVAWFVEQIVANLKTMIATLDGIKEGDGTLLDHSILFASTDTGYAKLHSLENIPLITAGGAGGRLKTGLHYSAKGEPATRVGLTIQHALGVPVSGWGTESNRATAPITEFLA